MNAAVSSKNQNPSGTSFDRGHYLPRVEKRLRHRMRGSILRSAPVDDEAMASAAPANNTRQFLAAFAGGLVFFSILIA